MELQQVVEAVQAETPPPAPRKSSYTVPGNPGAGRRVAHGRKVATDAQIEAVIRQYNGNLAGEQFVALLHKKGLATGEGRVHALRKKLYPHRRWPRGKAAVELAKEALKNGGVKKPLKLFPAKAAALPKKVVEGADPLQPIAEALKATMASVGISSLTAKLHTDGRVEVFIESVRKLEV